MDKFLEWIISLSLSLSFSLSLAHTFLFLALYSFFQHFSAVGPGRSQRAFPPVFQSIPLPQMSLPCTTLHSFPSGVVFLEASSVKLACPWDSVSGPWAWKTDMRRCFCQTKQYSESVCYAVFIVFPKSILFATVWYAFVWHRKAPLMPLSSPICSSKLWEELFPCDLSPARGVEISLRIQAIIDQLLVSPQVLLYSGSNIIVICSHLHSGKLSTQHQLSSF